MNLPKAVPAMRSEYIPFEMIDKMGEICAVLIGQHVQFTVCPSPNDLKQSGRTGWLVSWPNDPFVGGKSA